jgi:hypothetical protein
MPAQIQVQSARGRTESVRSGGFVRMCRPSIRGGVLSGVCATLSSSLKRSWRMPSYCVNRLAQSNGDHEVHDVTANKWCLPTPANRQDLGYHGTCSSAVQAAKSYFSQVNGCRWCAPACHTG